MNSADFVRKLRADYAKSGRQTGSWKTEEGTGLILRRELRRFRRELFAHATFHRLIENINDAFIARELVSDLQQLAIFVGHEFSREEAKELRAQYLDAKANVEKAASILRTYAKTAPKDNRQTLLDAALEIEKSPWYADEAKIRERGIFIFVDFSKFGQKGDERAYAIRCLDTLLPAEIPERDAMIRDFLELIGIGAPSTLVRSTRLNGRT